MEFHDDYPQYETMYLHDEEAGKKVRKKLWRVFWILLAITLIELFVGFNATAWGLTGGMFLKVFFIFFTIAKAAGIVLVFMHLIDETKFFRYVILGPYSVFILYLIYIILVEGTYTGYPENNTHLDDKYKVQQVILRTQHHQPLPETLKEIKLTPEQQTEANTPVSHTATDAQENAAEETHGEHH
jgi:cytochrome c oxidase subunit IV